MEEIIIRFLIVVLAAFLLSVYLYIKTYNERRANGKETRSLGTYLIQEMVTHNLIVNMLGVCVMVTIVCGFLMVWIVVGNDIFTIIGSKLCQYFNSTITPE